MIITADKLERFGSMVVFAFETFYPNGLSLEELEQIKDSQNWLRRIYDAFKEGD